MQYLKKLLLGSKVSQRVTISVIIFLLICYSFMTSKLNKINHSSEAEATPSAEEYFEVDKVDNNTTTNELHPNEVIWDKDDENVVADKDIINILLIGQDRRPGEGRARSDSMIIATINKQDNSIKFTSLMRDMYVQIPGFSDNKINAAYALGGMELLDDTIEKNFLVHIDGNIEVDFEEFTKIIDKIGGVDIEINKEEAEYLNKYMKSNFTAGTCSLTGDIALEYSRIRYIGNGDYERTERQRKVLLAAFEKIKNSKLPTLLELADEIFPLITTDLSNAKIIGYVSEIMSMGISNIETYRIPADGEFTSARIREMSVLVPDLSANRALLKEYIWSNSKE